MFAYEESRLYKYSYEEVFHTTLKVLQSSGCHIKAADFKAGLIFATYGGFFRGDVEWPSRVSILEYIWILFTPDDTFTEIKMKSGRTVSGNGDFNWEDILYKLDIKLKEHNSYSISQGKIHQKPRSIYSVIAAFLNPIFIYLVYNLSYTGGFIYSNFPGNKFILLIGGLIITSGAIFNAFRFYKIGIVLSIIGVILLISSLNLLAIMPLSIWNIFVLRDAWEYSKWNKYISEQRRNKKHKKILPITL